MLLQLGPSTVLATEEGCARSGWVVEVPDAKGEQLISDKMATRYRGKQPPRVVFTKGGPNISPNQEQPEPQSSKRG